jgi:Ca2+-binding RTX toxin-like protein
MGTGADTFRAGSGNDVITAGSGNNTIIAGSGHDTLTGGTGADNFTFIDGQAGGNVVITDFTVGTDKLTLQGYNNNAFSDALKHAVVAGGSTTITLQDHTTITFANVTNLNTDKLT